MVAAVTPGVPFEAEADSDNVRVMCATNAVVEVGKAFETVIQPGDVIVAYEGKLVGQGELPPDPASYGTFAMFSGALKLIRPKQPPAPSSLERCLACIGSSK